MTGLTGNNILAGSSGQGGYEIEQSLRVDGYPGTTQQILTRSPSSSGNRRTFTISFWWKPSLFNKAEDDHVIKVKPNNDNQFMFNKKAGADNISIVTEVSTSVKTLATTRVFRDPNWYHFVIAVDTTQATASNRVKLYVNGVQETDFSTEQYPDQNWELPYNESGVNQDLIYSREDLGRSPSGYFAEWHSIDGTALDASSFGETNADTNQWVPIKYAGSYGTNGFYLNFSDSASLGADTSGNGNNFTPTNLAATDQVPDSPTNNFATINALTQPGGTGSLSEGNLKFNGTADYVKEGSFEFPDSGKWYYEAYLITSGRPYIGIRKSPWSSGSPSVYYGVNEGLPSEWAKIYKDGSNISTISDLASPYVLGVAFNSSTGDIEFFRNGSSIGSTTVSDTSVRYIPTFIHNSSGGQSTFTLNFGQDSSFAGAVSQGTYSDANGKGEFAYQPPSGYLALCEDNLPDPSIALPGDYFNTVLYTGNGSTQSISGVGFQPDAVWLKHRNNPTPYGHQMFDAVRGATNYLTPNTTTVDTTDATTLTSFDSDGFSLGSSVVINQNTINHVAWNWKGNGSGSSNTDGATTSTVSANPSAGFSIVSWTNHNTTVGHGLSQAPELMFIKSRDNGGASWVVYNKTIGNSNYMLLNSTVASTSGPTFFNSTSPTSSIFTVGTGIGGATDRYIAYCFHSVEGYSKIGSYTANGSADGPFVYTGFTPAFIIFKNTSAVEAWSVFDIKRNPINGPDANMLLPSSTATESSTANRDIDFVSNGFKLRSTALNPNTTSGNTYIYMAFAESPFKYSTAR